MNIKTTLFLLALLIGIGAYFMLFESGREEIPDPNPGDREKPVFIAEELFPDGVKTAEIHWADGQRATLTRDEQGKWMQTAPVKFPLNTVRLQAGLVMDAATLRYVEKFTPDTVGKPTLAQTSLDKPRASVRFIGEYRDTRIDRNTGAPIVTTKPFEQTIHLGAGLTGSRAYLRINNDPDVYVTSNALHVILLNERVADWRARSLDTPTDAQTQRITIEAEDKTIGMLKTLDEWLFTLPLTDRVAPKAPAAILAALKSTAMGRFVADEPKDLAAFGLDKPGVTVTVHTAATEPRVRTLRIGSPADPSAATYHASWSLGDEPSNVVFTITRDSRARFMAITADDLRDPRITTVKAASIAEVTLRLPDQTAVQLQKTTEAGWNFLVPKGQPALPFKPDQDAVGALIDTLATASAKYYRPSTGKPDKPLAHIELATRFSTSQPDQLIIFTPPPGTAPKGDDTPFLMVLRNNEQTGYLVPAAKLQPLLEPIIKLRDRQVIDVKPDTIERVALKRADGITYDFRSFIPSVAVNNKPQWQLTGHEVFEREMFEFLLKQLPALRAETWLADAKPFGKNTVDLLLEIKGRSPITLTFDIDTRQAKFTGTDGVFVLNEQMKLLLDGEYRPRSVLKLATGDVTQVTIRKGDAKPLTIGKDDLGRYQALGPDGKPLTTIQVNPTSSAKLFDALTPLRAWRLIAKQEVSLNEATTTLELMTRTGIKHTIHIGFKDQPTVATVNDVWFTLPPDTLARLMAEPMKKE